MGALLGAVILLFGGFAFGRSVAGARQGAWAGPRTPGMRQRAGRGGGQRTVRQEMKLAWGKVKATDWLEQQRHHRKNGATAATGGTPATVTAVHPPNPLQRARQAAQSRRFPASATGSGGGETSPVRPAAAPGLPPQATAPSNGRTATVASNGNAVEQFVEGVNQIHAQAQAGGIHAKHAAVKACHEACVRFASMAQMLSRQMSEPGMNYGNEITEPIAKSATQLQASAMTFSEADSALTTLENMTVGELAQSSRQAPHHQELSEDGSH